MPAEKFTKKASTPKLKRQWSKVEASAKAHGSSPGSAVRQTNAVVKKASAKKKK